MKRSDLFLILSSVMISAFLYHAGRPPKEHVFKIHGDFRRAPEGEWQKPVTEEELRAYYAAHQEAFRTPVRIYIKSITTALMTLPADEIRRDPARETQWQLTGWWEEGSPLNVSLSGADIDKIFRLEKGEISSLVKDRHGVGYLVWVLDRQEPRFLSYEEARPELLRRSLARSN